MIKNKGRIVWGIFISVTFIVLLLIRLEFFEKRPEPTAAVTATGTKMPQDTWMSIYQKTNKIGYVHRTFTERAGGFHFQEQAVLQINTMGVTQALSLTTEGDLNPDMTISSFNFELQSSLFRFNVRGIVAKNKLVLYTGKQGSLQKNEIPLKEIPHLSGGIYDAAFSGKMSVDEVRLFNIFDPSTLGMRSVRVARKADEIIPIMGKRVMTQKYCADFMGAENCAWLNKEGDVLKEKGIIGLSLEKSSPEKARAGIMREGAIDFTEIAAISVAAKIAEPAQLKALRVKISGIDRQPLFLHGGRQSRQKDILTITRESFDTQSAGTGNLPENFAAFLKPTGLIQSSHPEITAQLRKIVQSTDTPKQKAVRIIEWVFRNIEKKPVLSVPSALETLKNHPPPPP
ncbi:MAG TPA: hypothetical protein PKZ12_04520, partial [Smithellaceae bacterium]|nr:hypothetical protein [Smithellaceae bacterium]